jgi:hypothetical protein
MLSRKPTLRQIEAPIQKRVSLRPGVHCKHALLAIGDFAQHATVLPRDTHRMLALLGKAAPVYYDYSVRVAQGLRHQLLLALQHGFVVQIAGANEVLSRPHCIAVRAFERQHHRLDRLALYIRQLALQIKLRPFPLFAPLEQIAKLAMIGYQLLRHRFHIARRKIQRWFTAAGWRCLQSPPLSGTLFAHGMSPFWVSPHSISHDFSL